MNWNSIKCGWKQFKGNVKQQWGKLASYLMASRTCDPDGISRSQMAVWRECQERKDHPK